MKKLIHNNKKKYFTSHTAQRSADIINTISPPPTHTCNQAQLLYIFFFGLIMQHIHTGTCVDVLLYNSDTHT